MYFIVNGATRIELVLVHHADIQRLACTLTAVSAHHQQYERRSCADSPSARVLSFRFGATTASIPVTSVLLRCYVPHYRGGAGLPN